MTTYNKNIATDFGWNNDADATARWESGGVRGFITGTMVAGDTLVLTGPQATYTFNRGSGSSVPLTTGKAGGITIIHDFPRGTIFTDGGGTGFFLSDAAMYDDNVHSSRIAAVQAGQTSVTLLTPAENTRFPVGQWAIVGGFDVQGAGSPINLAFYDILKITAVSGATITFDAPITHDLLTTWPLFNPGDSTHPDCGGPATIWILPPSFDLITYWNGITFNQGGSQTYFRGRFAQFTNGGCSGSAGIVPSLTKVQRYINFDQTACTIEVDKLIDELTYLRSPVSQLGFQSMSSAKVCNIIDSAVTTINGTPRALRLLRATVGSFQLCPAGYGRTEVVRADASVLSAISNSTYKTDCVALSFGMSGGVITFSKSGAGVQAWAVPGTNCYFSGSNTAVSLLNFKVNAVTISGDTVSVVTDATGTFPATPNDMNLNVHPCPVHVGTGNSGSTAATDWDTGQGGPLFITPLSAANCYVPFDGTLVGGSAILLASNIFGVDSTAVDPADYYIPGAYPTAISTSDHYGIDGLYWLRPYDLTLWGSPGASIAASNERYFWVASPDHPTGGQGSWQDGQDFRGGFSHDPGVPPQSLDIQIMPRGGTDTKNLVLNRFSGGAFNIYQGPFIDYCPEDTGHEFHLFAEGTDVGATAATFTVTGTKTDSSAVITGISDMTRLLGDVEGTKLNGTGIPANSNFVIDGPTQITMMGAVATGSGAVTLTCLNKNISHNEGAARSTDLLNWTAYGTTEWGYTGNGWTSLGRVIRNGANDYDYLTTSYLPQSKDGQHAGDTLFTYNVSTSTNGIDFTRPDPPSQSFCAGAGATINTQLFLLSAWDPIVVGGVKWIAGTLDGRNVTISLANPAVITKPDHGYVPGDTVTFIAFGAPYNGTTTSGSPVVTGMGAAFSGVPAMIDTLFAGCAVGPTGTLPRTTGPLHTFGIPTGTTILSVDSSTQITLSKNVTFTGSNTIIGLTLPAPILPDVTYYVIATGLTTDTFQISATLGGTAISTSGSTQYAGLRSHYVPNGKQYLTRISVDSDYVFQTDSVTKLVTYDGVYPGPSYLQSLSNFYNADDGICHYYAVRGFFQSAPDFAFIDGAVYANGGALQQQMIDHLCEIIDPAAAATASPVGVRASCTAGTVTITWYHTAQPGNTYRLYKGSIDKNPANITTLVGDVASGTATDTPTADTRWWYRLVKLNGGSAAGERIVDVWASSASAFVNKHILRAKKDGATDIDKAYLQACYQWMIDKGYFGALEKWVNPSFGQVKDGSNIVSKAWDLGATRKAYHGDVEFCKGSPGVRGTSTTTYSATGLSSHPAWTAGDASSYIVFGGLCDANNQNGRLNPFRRMVEITAVACYAKSSSSGDTALLALDQFGGMNLVHAAGSPGTAQFTLSDDVATGVATATLSGSATARHVIAGTFGHTGNLLAYADGVAGSASSTALHINADLSLPTTLKGVLGSSNTAPFLNSGSLNSRFNYDPTTSTYSFSSTSTPATISDLIVFSKEMSATDLASLQTLLTTRAYP